MTPVTAAAARARTGLLESAARASMADVHRNRLCSAPAHAPGRTSHDDGPVNQASKHPNWLTKTARAAHARAVRLALGNRLLEHVLHHLRIRTSTRLPHNHTDERAQYVGVACLVPRDHICMIGQHLLHGG